MQAISQELSQHHDKVSQQQSTLQEVSQHHDEVSQQQAISQEPWQHRDEASQEASQHHDEASQLHDEASQQEEFFSNYDNTTVHPIIEVTNAPDNDSDASQALPRTFLVLYEIYSELLNKKTNTDFHEIFSIDAKSDGDLFQMYERCGKEDLFTSAIDQLEEFDIISLDDDDQIINGTRWFIFWHFYITKNNIDSNNSISEQQLYESLRSNHRVSLNSTVIKYIKKEYFKYTCYGDDDVLIEYGTKHDDLDEEKKTFIDEYYIKHINNAISNNNGICELSEILEEIYTEEDTRFDQSIKLLHGMNIFHVNYDNFSKGSQWFTDNQLWLQIDDHQQTECHNCKRKQCTDTRETYKIQLRTVQSKNIRRRATFKHITAYTGSRSCQYVLCHQCYQYLVEKEDHFKNIWPSFYWILLSGSYKDFFNTSYNFFDIYKNGMLWKFIPKTMRMWWIDAIKTLKDRSGSIFPYEHCTIDLPPPIFEDKTIHLAKFNEDFNSEKLSRVVDAMNNKDVINKNVLCPWSCTTSCRDCGKINLDTMIQRMLLNINLPLFHQKYNKVHHSWDMYNRNANEYDLILLNDEWKIKPSIVIDENGVHVLTCKYHDGGEDKLSLFTPQSPSKNIFNADISDQLSHCVKIPRITKPMKAKKYNTTFAMVQCHSSYSGVDTMSLTTKSNFNKCSELLSQHEDATIIGREDINHLLHNKIKNSEISPELANSFLHNAKARYTKDHLRRRCQGSTYVGFEDIVRIQLFESSQNKEINVLIERDDDRPSPERSVRRSWSIIINLLQTEDSNGYGSQFRPIPKFKTNSKPSLLTWSLFAILSSCKELWYTINSKNGLFYSNGWEGWVLTAIQHMCFQYDTISLDPRSPFKKTKNLSTIVSKVNAFLSNDLNNNDRDDPASFYKFDVKCFENLFQEDEYTSSISILSSTEDALSQHTISEMKKKSVIIVVGDKNATEGELNIDTAVFELRVVCIIKSDRESNCPSKFDAIRFMRHGNGFNSWWKQERNESIVTKCSDDTNVFLGMEDTNDDLFFLQYIQVYIKKHDDEGIEGWRMKLFESFGGKTHVRCECCQFPLIPSYRSSKNKLKCNINLHINEDGTRHQCDNLCTKKESYVCSNAQCNVKICNRCYNALPTDEVTIVNTLDDQEEDNESIEDNVHSDEESNTSERQFDVDETSVSTNVSTCSDNFVNNMENFICHTDQDITLDTTEDNVNNDEGFITTNAGDHHNNIIQNNNNNGEVVSGHIIFNQVGSCTARKRHTITGTSRQRHFVQNLCSTSAGQSYPLLYPEASLFPRHFYASARHDKFSILGAQPIFLLTEKKYSYGFTSSLYQARIHMTNGSSTTSTDMEFMCYYFDILANKLLNTCHSRDIFQRGFVVDDKSSIGMSVKDKDSSNLSESIDSRQMVLNLSSSQKYVKYTWFLTFTANHREHPGLAHLHEWKTSMKWTNKIDNYENLSPLQKEEMKKGMEQAYGVHIYDSWHSVKYLLLKHIQQHLSILGTVLVIFARDEYQKIVGNLCHNHLIAAILKHTQNANSEKYIQDLIRTNVMELVRTDDDLERLINDGLLKSVDDVPQIKSLANTILTHKCDDRCLMRVGDGDRPENFKCRKLHPVKDSPDPTKHNYVKIPYKFQKHTIEILEEIGMYTPSTNPALIGEFTHAYFQPSRHIAPCNYNAKCNMSPVIVDFFIALRSMQNAQALEHTNGTSKYVCKYLGKFDEGNYVVLCEDIHTGEWVLGKTHLHNTKIVTSKFNEDKAFAKDRNKNHPKGRDMPHFEIRQILMGDPEVFTNLNFLKISTLPFELRPTNRIQIEDSTRNPPDTFSSNIPSQEVRTVKNFPDHKKMSKNQILTYGNHNGNTTKYDMISIFSLRPPELLKVFTNPVDYFRYCHIDKNQLSEEKMDELLCIEMNMCVWIDCLGRRITIRESAFEEVGQRIAKNLEKYNDIDDDAFNEAELFARDMNNMVMLMINTFQTPNESLSLRHLMWSKMTIVDFIFNDKGMLLPVPVLSNSSPSNAHNFLIHIILSLGEYDTEIDALTQQTMRKCLQHVGLIGEEGEEDSLRMYSGRLSRKYIEEQLVHFPNSLSKSETFITMAKRVFDDAIVHNCLSMNELPPFTMSNVRAVNDEKIQQFWTSLVNSQLHSVYTTLCNINNLPTQDEILQAHRHLPLDWNPLENLQQYEHQTNESFAEQEYAIEVFVKQIQKYRDISGNSGMTYTKNNVVYGAPGTGKSFIGQYTVLYALSQGLNIISTALMGVRANTLGGIHLHKIFFLPTDKKISSPFVYAEKAIEDIKRNIEIYHALRTLDILFIDEFGQVSAEQLCTIDIILRKIRQSQIPFGGVLFLCTMDHMQLQPIKQLPVLTSSMMITCFQMVRLEHSVRAHSDIQFQRLQAITRMNPYVLLQSEELKMEFFDLTGRILTYVNDWTDQKIGPNMMRAFSRIRPAQEALNEYRESVKRRLNDVGIVYRISRSTDTQRTRSTHAEFYAASEQSIKSLNKDLKEPTELVFFVGGVYECTINDQRGRYSQSQLAYMLDLPSQDSVDQFNAIPLWIAPPGTHNVLFNHQNIPSREELTSAGWNEVNIGIAPERIILARGGFQAKRIQYSLKHIGATTINKSQGATLPLGIAIEITEEYCPWEKGQIVVCLSRTTTAANTVIVGEKTFAINKMWELITIGNQWTRYTEHILNSITINNSQQNPNQTMINYPEVYPFRICDSNVPTDTTGFIYCLVSMRHTDKIYIGETKCLAQRLAQHNSCNGARGTADVRYIPWGVAAYICGLSHMTTIERMSLERDWKLLVDEMIRFGQNNTFSWINAGARIVNVYNQGNREEHIRFVCCITPENVC